MELASARGEGRRTAHCRARQRQHDRADAKKNILKPHRKQQWVIRPTPTWRLSPTWKTSWKFIKAARSAAPARVPRRILEAADHRDARADPRETRTSSGTITNMNAMASPICSWCSRRWRLAACQGHRPPHRHRLCPRAQGFVRHAFSRHGQNRAGAGKSQHPQASLALWAFPAPEARRLVERFEWHYILKHGSWLDLAESELGVLRVAMSGSPHR